MDGNKKQNRKKHISFQDMGTQVGESPSQSDHGMQGSSKGHDMTDDDLDIIDDPAEGGPFSDQQNLETDINNNNGNQRNLPNLKATPKKSAMKRNMHSARVSLATESDFAVSIATKKRVGYADIGHSKTLSDEEGTDDVVDSASGFRGKTTTPTSLFSESEYKSFMDDGRSTFTRQSVPCESREAVYQQALTLMSERCVSRYTSGVSGRSKTPLVYVKQEPYGEYIPEYFYVQQQKPVPMPPLKAWRGYSGNVYFEPINVNKAPLGISEYLGPEMDRRSEKAVSSRSRLGGSRSDTSSHCSGETPSTRTTPASSATYARKNNGKFSRVASTATSRSAKSGQSRNAPRQMSLLDKGTVFSRFNQNIHEDIEWIVGQESTGSLCISAQQKTLISNRREKKRQHSKEKICRGSMAHRIFEEKRLKDNIVEDWKKASYPYHEHYQQSYTEPMNPSYNSEKLPPLDKKGKYKNLDTSYVPVAEKALRVASEDIDMVKNKPLIRFSPEIRYAYKQKQKGKYLK